MCIRDRRRTLTDLLELTPMVQSVAAVPCGVTLALAVRPFAPDWRTEQ